MMRRLLAYLWSVTISTTINPFSRYPNMNIPRPNSQSQQATTLPIVAVVQQHSVSGIHNSNSSPVPVPVLKLAKTAVTLVVPVTELLLDDDKGLTPFQSGFITIALSLGFAATLNGMLLKGALPRAASAMEKSGAALIFVGFYGLLSSSLPPALGWVCWLCFASSCVPLVWSILPLNFNSTSTDETTTHFNSDPPRPRRPPV